MKPINALLLVLVLLAVAAQTTAAQKHYQSLGLSSSATQAEIKKAFRKLATAHHPEAIADSKEREKARKAFVKVTEAYEILSDPAKRKLYDESGGQRVVSQGEDRNFLRYNLFHDFAGTAISETEMQAAIDQKIESPSIIFFWSTNFPECIDSAPAFKLLAERLRGASTLVQNFKCDDAYHLCRGLKVPAIAYFEKGKPLEFYPGKVEVQLLEEFVVKRLPIKVREPSVDTLDVSPGMKRWEDHFASYRQCIPATIVNDIVAYQYSPCSDCDIHLRLTLDVVSASFSLDTRKVRCVGSHPCKALKVKDRAWTIVSQSRTCWFWTQSKKGLGSTCDAVKQTVFNGRFIATDLTQFLTANQPMGAKRITAAHITNLKKQNDSYAILFHRGLAHDAPEMVQWNLLSTHLNKATTTAYKSKRGQLFAGIVNCNVEPGACTDVQAQGLPVVAVYGFGTKVKRKAPVVWGNLGGWRTTLRDIVREANPLHLHLLGPKAYDKKINEILNKNKAWLIVYNAGQWCPPCNQIRSVWKDVTRRIQESKHAKKIAVGLVECDDHKSLCQQLNIGGFPTMAFLKKGRARNEFQGNRDAKSIVEWAIDQLDSKLASMAPQEVHQRIQAGEKLVVCFTAGTWCPPCTAIGPNFKQASNSVDIPMVSINCDDVGQFCHMYNIQGYPTVVLFNKGHPLFYEGGDKRADALVAWIKARSA